MNKDKRFLCRWNWHCWHFGIRFAKDLPNKKQHGPILKEPETKLSYIDEYFCCYCNAKKDKRSIWYA